MREKITSNTTFDFHEEKHLSTIKIGNVTISNPKKFNKIQKVFWKLLLNIDIHDKED